MSENTAPDREPGATEPHDNDVLDLTREAAPPPRGDAAPAVIPYDPSRDRERYRGLVAGALLLLLAFTVIGAFFSFWFNWASQEEVEGLLTIVFAPVVGLVGAATGFYFGAATAGGSRPGQG